MTFDRCKFTNNSTHSTDSDGSCIYSEGTVTIQNCLFYDNDCDDNNGTSSYGNGDVYIDDGTATITNCTFTENGSADAVIMCYGGTTTIKNCLLTNNSNTNSIKERHGTVNISYTYYDDGTSYYSTSGFSLGSGNLTSGTVGFTDASNDDFRIGYSSVCKNVGTATGAPSVDFAENTRNGDGSGYDMGAYEYICGTPVAGTAATSTATVCNGNTGSLTLSGETARAIKWQQSSTSDFSSGVSDVNSGSGYTTNSFTTAALSTTTYYRVAATCTGAMGTYNIPILLR